jgi:ATP-binding protein involved in chromosome partitioning
MIYQDIAVKAWQQLQESTLARSDPPRLEISLDRSQLAVTFDGARPFTLTAEMLRVMSPSAEVQGHSPEQRVTVGGKRKVKINELKTVGNYAVRIVVAGAEGPRARLASPARLLQSPRRCITSAP